MAQNIFQDPFKMDWHMSCLQIFYSIKQIKRGRTDEKAMIALGLVAVMFLRVSYVFSQNINPT